MNPTVADRANRVSKRPVMRRPPAWVGVLLATGLAVACGPSAAPAITGTPTAGAATAPPSAVVSPLTARPLSTNPAGSGTMGPYRGTSTPAGTYFLELDGYRYTFTVPTAGWWTNDYSGFVPIGKVHGDNGPMTRLFLMSGDGGEVFADACHWAGTNATPGATVDDLVAALAAVHGFESSVPSDTTVGGYSGKHLRLTVPTDVNLADCDGGQYHGLDGFYDIPAGQVQDYWVFEADGSRHVFWSAFDGDAPTEAQADLMTLIDSLRIEKVAP